MVNERGTSTVEVQCPKCGARIAVLLLPAELLYPPEAEPVDAFEPGAWLRHLHEPPEDSLGWLPSWAAFAPLAAENRVEMPLTHCGTTWRTSGAGLARHHHQGKPLLS